MLICYNISSGGNNADTIQTVCAKSNNESSWEMKPQDFDSFINNGGV